MAVRRVAAALTNGAGDPPEDEIDAGAEQDLNDQLNQDDEDGEQEQDGEQEDEDGEGEQQEEPAQRPRRAQRNDAEDDRFAEMERRTAAAEAKAAEVEQRYQARERQANQESPEAEATRLALMTPEEQMQHRIDKSLRTMQATVQQAQFQSINASDKVAFDALVRENPTFAALSSKVEAKHAELVRAGTAPSRMDVLTYMLGQQALERAKSDAAKRGSQQRQQRVQQQRTRPTGARSDVSSQRRGGQTLEDRLANVAL